jgi:hypothetical protein
MSNISELSALGSSIKGDVIRKGSSAWEVGGNKLGDLSDSIISSQLNNQVVAWDQSSGRWVNASIADLITLTGYLEGLSDDTSPELAANLDAGGFQIDDLKRLIVESSSGHTNSSLSISNNGVGGQETFILKGTTTTTSTLSDPPDKMLLIGGLPEGSGKIEVPDDGVLFYSLDLIGIKNDDPTVSAVWHQQGAFYRDGSTVAIAGATITEEISGVTGSLGDWNFGVRVNGTDSISVYVEGGTSDEQILWTACLRVTTAIG